MALIVNMEKLLYQLAEEMISALPWLVFGGVLLFFIIKHLLKHNEKLDEKVDKLETFIREDLLTRNEEQSKINLGLTSLIQQMKSESETKWIKIENLLDNVRTKLIEIELKSNG